MRTTIKSLHFKNWIVGVLWWMQTGCLIITNTAMIKLSLSWIKTRKSLANWCKVSSYQGTVHSFIVFRGWAGCGIQNFPYVRVVRVCNFYKLSYKQWSRTAFATRKQLSSPNFLWRTGSVSLVNMLTILQYAGCSMSSSPGLQGKSLQKCNAEASEISICSDHLKDIWWSYHIWTIRIIKWIMKFFPGVIHPGKEAGPVNLKESAKVPDMNTFNQLGL